MASSATYSTVVEQLYAIYLNRDGDASGLQDFEAALAAANAPTTLAGLQAAYGSNAAVTAVINGFGTSAEYISLHSADLSGNNASVTVSAGAAGDFVNAVFEHVLGRAPLAAGMAFWTNAITSGTLHVADAALAIEAASSTNSGSVVIVNSSNTNGSGVASTTSTGLQSSTLNSGTVDLSSSTSSVTTTNSVNFVGNTGVTVNGGTDNAHVTLNIAGASIGQTDTITLGNGNDDITDASTAGSVTITVGTGSNNIDIHTGTGAGFYSVTLGTHTATTGADSIYVSEIGTFSGAAVANTTITGTAAGDVLAFASAATSAANVTLAQQTAISGAASLSAAVALAFADTPAANGALSFQYGGNTYVIEQSGAAGSAQVATDSIIELVGVHTLTAGVVAGGHVVLAS